MAKGNMLQGQARGKVGDLVFSVLKGQQVSKVYNAKPSNPKTTSQMAQRVKLGAAVGFYKRNKPFFKFAFKKKATESDYNAFIRNNINIAPYLSKEDVVSNNLCPAPYIMTQGDLPEIPIMSTSQNTYDGVKVCRTTFGIDSEADTLTFGIIREQFGLNYGDMLTVYGVASAVTGQPQFSPVITNLGSICYAQVVFSAELENEDATDIGNWSKLSNVHSVEWDTGEMTVHFTTPLIQEYSATDHLVFGACAVASRKVAGSGLEVSTSRIVLDQNGSFAYAKYRDEASLQKAMDSYGRQENAFLEPGEKILRP